jgi:hypothetical protein
VVWGLSIVGGESFGNLVFPDLVFSACNRILVVSPVNVAPHVNSQRCLAPVIKQRRSKTERCKLQVENSSCTTKNLEHKKWTPPLTLPPPKAKRPLTAWSGTVTHVLLSKKGNYSKVAKNAFLQRAEVGWKICARLPWGGLMYG